MISVAAGPYGGGGPSGLQRYVGGMVGPLLAAAPDAVVFTGSRAAAAEWAGRAHRVRVPGHAGAGFVGNALRLAWSQTALPAALRRLGARAHYAPLPEGMLRPPCPQVVTVHDLIPLRFPEDAPRQAEYYRRVLPRLLRAAAAVVAVSRATAEDVRERLGVEGVPVHVVHQGYRADVFRPAAPGEPPTLLGARLGDFVLAVGETRGYKNLRGAVHALARAGVPGLRLVVVGRVLPSARELVELPRRLGIGDRVEFLGPLADGELAGLYRSARCLLFPSLWEGFGIPLLEAMACGCPVVASGVASLPEVCGDAALYVDPRDPESIADGLRRAACDDSLRAELAARGLARAREFSYERAARQVLEIVRGVMGEGEPAARRNDARPREALTRLA